METKLFNEPRQRLKDGRYCSDEQKRPDYLRPCHSCKVLKKVRTTVWAGYGDECGEECERIVNVLFCEKTDCFIHPPSVAVKGNAFEMGEKFNVEMPKECKYYKKIEL